MSKIVFSAVILSALLAAMPMTALADDHAEKDHKIQKAGSLVKEELADTMLNLRLRVAILEHLRTDGVDVKISVTDSIATLNGQMDTAAMRDLAVDVARNTPGVKKVESNLTVKAKENSTPIASAVGKAERGMKDSLLEAKVKMKLLEQNGKPAMNVEVNATDGVVRLLGNVDGKSRRETIVKTTKGIAGVKEVHDLMSGLN